MQMYAVIPTHNRPGDLAALLASIPESVYVLVVDNASEPPLSGLAGLRGPEFLQFLGRRIQVHRDEEQPPNLSRLWNIGLDWAAELHQFCCGNNDHYAVAVLNDDVVLPPNFFDVMSRAFEVWTADIAFPGATFRANVDGGPVGLADRMTGFCFVVRGSSGIRADEQLRWWCGDDDIEQQALQHARGTVRVLFPPGAIVHHHPDQSTAANPVLQEQTRQDMATFVEKWGFRPW